MKTEVNKTEVSDIKTIRSGFDINGDNLHLNIKVEKDGEEIYNERGNSLLFHFIAELATMFNMGSNVVDTTVDYPTDRTQEFYGGRYDFAPYCCLFQDSSSTGYPDSNSRFHEFTIDSWDGTNIVVSHVNTLSIQEPIRNSERVCIVGGTYAGNYKVLSRTGLTTTTTELELEGLNANSGTAIDGSAVIGYKYYRNYYSYNSITQNQSRNQLKRFNIFVGESDQAVDLHDIFLPGYLDDSIIEISGGLPTVSTPTIATDSSRIAISQGFTNVSGSDKTIREIGLGVNVQDDTTINSDHRVIIPDNSDTEPLDGTNGVALAARDLVSPFVVAHQETFTITYEIVINAVGSDGVVAGFNEMLYREIADADRVARTYFNSDWNNGPADGSQDDYFAMQPGAQFNMFPILHNGENYSYFGLQVGSNEDDVDIDDYYLRNAADSETRIHHGDGDGKLFYYPTQITKVVTTATDAYFELERLYENRGSTDVVIKEVGLTGAYFRSVPVLLARNVLASGDWITLSAGQIAKVVYRIGISTS